MHACDHQRRGTRRVRFEQLEQSRGARRPEALERLFRQTIGRGLDLVATGAAARGEAALAVDPAAGAQELGARRPVVVAPPAVGLDRVEAGAARGDLAEVRFARMQAGGSERGDVSVAAVLAHERRRVPEGHVRRLARPTFGARCDETELQYFLGAARGRR